MDNAHCCEVYCRLIKGRSEVVVVGLVNGGIRDQWGNSKKLVRDCLSYMPRASRYTPAVALIETTAFLEVNMHSFLGLLKMFLLLHGVVVAHSGRKVLNATYLGTSSQVRPIAASLSSSDCQSGQAASARRVYHSTRTREHKLIGTIFYTVSTLQPRP